MKVDGIDYGLETPWEIDVPDDSIVIENTDESRIPPALTDVPQAVRSAIRNPMGTAPLADQVSGSSKVALILDDWMGVSVHAVPVVLEELLADRVRQQPHPSPRRGRPGAPGRAGCDRPRRPGRDE